MVCDHGYFFWVPTPWGGMALFLGGCYLNPHTAIGYLYCVHTHLQLPPPWLLNLTLSSTPAPPQYYPLWRGTYRGVIVLAGVRVLPQFQLLGCELSLDYSGRYSCVPPELGWKTGFHRSVSLQVWATTWVSIGGCGDCAAGYDPLPRFGLMGVGCTHFYVRVLTRLPTCGLNVCPHYVAACYLTWGVTLVGFHSRLVRRQYPHKSVYRGGTLPQCCVTQQGFDETPWCLRCGIVRDLTRIGAITAVSMSRSLVSVFTDSGACPI